LLRSAPLWTNGFGVELRRGIVGIAGMLELADKRGDTTIDLYGDGQDSSSEGGAIRTNLIPPGEVLTPDLLGIDLRPSASDARLESFHQAKARLIAEWEQAYLAQLLKQAGGNVSRAARDAELHRPHLYRLMKKHGMDHR
jgi:hypothetical protein